MDRTLEGCLVCEGCSATCFERSYRLDTALYKNIVFIIPLINICIFSCCLKDMAESLTNLNNRKCATWIYGTTTH